MTSIVLFLAARATGLLGKGFQPKLFLKQFFPSDGTDFKEAEV